MKPQKGIVLKVSQKGIIVMGRDGRFYRLPKSETIPLMGEEVELPAELLAQAEPQPRRLSWSKIRVWAMAASIVLVLSLSLLLYPSQPEAAYVVALDINPSLELYMDERDAVIRAVPVDPEGEALLRQIPLKGLPLAEAVRRITAEAEKQGYLDQENGHIFATVVQWKDQSEDHVAEKVEQTIAQIRPDRIVIQVSDKETYEKVHEEKLSVPKYQIKKELEREGIQVDPKEIQKSSVGELLKKYNLKPEKVLGDSKAQKEKNAHARTKYRDEKREKLERPREEKADAAGRGSRDRKSGDGHDLRKKRDPKENTKQPGRDDDERGKERDERKKHEGGKKSRSQDDDRDDGRHKDKRSENKKPDKDRTDRSQSGSKDHQKDDKGRDQDRGSNGDRRWKDERKP